MVHSQKASTVVLVVLVLGGLAGPVRVSQATPTTVTFTSAGEHSFTVPAGVTSLHVIAIGGAGGTGQGGGGAGGLGAMATADLTVTPGATLYVEVASAGGNAVPSCESRAARRPTPSAQAKIFLLRPPSALPVLTTTL